MNTRALASRAVDLVHPPLQHREDWFREFQIRAICDDCFPCAEYRPRVQRCNIPLASTQEIPKARLFLSEQERRARRNGDREFAARCKQSGRIDRITWLAPPKTYRIVTAQERARALIDEHVAPKVLSKGLVGLLPVSWTGS